MSIAFVPIYLNFIGAEGYGFIGFFIMLSSSLTILDCGLGAVATREAAAFIDGNTDRQAEISTLLKTIETIFLVIAIIIFIFILAISPLLIKYWIKIPKEMTDQALKIMLWIGINLGIQFQTSFYTGCINGFQNQLILNIINIIGSTIKSTGTILALWLISPTIEVFFQWQAIVSVVILLVQRKFYIGTLKEIHIQTTYSLKSLLRIRHFMAGTGLTNILGLFLTQLDKIILSSTLPIEIFGYYSLAWTLGTLIYRLTGPIFNSYYPRIAQLHELGNTELMLSTYKKSCSLMAIVIIPFSIWLSIYSNQILYIWTQNHLIADNTSSALSILALGSMFNGIMHMPYALQLTYHFTKLSLIQNIVSVILLAPLTYIFATYYTLTETAIPWLLVNFSYILIAAPLMYKHLNISGFLEWLISSVGKPIFISALVMLIIKYFWETQFQGQLPLIILGISFLFGTSLTIFALNSFRFNFKEWKNIL